MGFVSPFYSLSGLYSGPALLEHHYSHYPARFKSAHPLFMSALELDSAPTTAQPPETGDALKSLVSVIQTDELAFFSADSAKPIGTTVDTHFCIAVVVFEPESKRAFIAHYQAPADLDGLEAAISKLQRSAPRKPLKAYIFGGDFNPNMPLEYAVSEDNAEKILGILKDKGVQLVGADLLTNLGPDLGFDARTCKPFYATDSFSIMQREILAERKQQPGRTKNVIGRYTNVAYDGFNERRL